MTLTCFSLPYKLLLYLGKNLVDLDNDDSMGMLCSDPKMLEKLCDEAYCLKYFANNDEALEYIRQNRQKQIFFISSGTIGKEVVPKIAALPQIQGIYIFCGYIPAHTEWASEYVDKITAMLEHQDNLLERLTRDIAEYVEKKGDQHFHNEDMVPAKNCYAWAKKLLIRGQILGDTGLTKKINSVDEKLNNAQSPTECQN